MKINLNAFQESVKKFLEQYAQTDEDFATKYSNPKKSVEECCKYIIGEVKKALKKGDMQAVVSHEEVYGLAIHYFDEEDIEVDNKEIPVSVSVAQTPAPAQAEKSVEEKKQRKPRKSQKKAVVETDPDIPEPFDIPLF